MSEKTAAMLIGFGGPQNMAEVRPFLESVLEGIPIRPERFDEVLRHYEAVGGTSAYNSVTTRQKEALEAWLVSQKVAMPVGVGFRHSMPTFRDTFEIFKKQSVKKAIGFVLASFRSSASFEKYQAKMIEAQQQAGAEQIRVVYTDSFAQNPLYFEAQAEKAAEAMKSFSEKEKQETHLLFTAHSIPAATCEKSCEAKTQWTCYGSQFCEASAWIAQRLGFENQWSTAYQSRSGNPKDLWLEPDIKESLRRLESKKYKRVLFIPVGFLCDHMEVIYDLDIEAKQWCEGLGLKYFRASTVADHPKFIEMMGRQILEKV